MKSKLFLSILSFFLLWGNLFAQTHQGWCGAHETFEAAMKNDPHFASEQRNLESFTEQYSSQYIAQKTANTANKKQSVVRIIPVCVHVIHAGGTENISKAQILSQIDALNRDFRRMAADTAQTPGPFKSIAADSEIEFRMAKLDDNGNCTDGIDRVYSTQTVYARDNVKSLSYWPSNKYLNIWIVKSIRRADGSLPPAGTIIAGFAQFPGGAAATDGVVIAAANFGTIGTAQGNRGRTTVHEVGHWLNLRHIWADDGGTCVGSDFVADTPNQASENFSTCPSFPMFDACTTSGNGINFSNYMDYTDESCQNMYTVGQSARMNAALSSATSGRSNLWSVNNLAATGVSLPTTLCVADFINNTPENTICENGLVSFTDVSFNGPSTSRNWTINGGTFVAPSTASDSIISVRYTNAGVFDVSLSVSNGATTVSETKQALIHVLPSQAAYSNSLYTEGFESGAIPNVDWEVTSPDGGSFMWTQNTTTGFSGTASAFIENYSADSADVDDLTGPTINVQAIYNQTSPSSLTFSFQCAFAKRKAINNDALKILVSNDCGRSWTPRQTIAAANLSSVTGLKTNYFIPTASEWKKQTVSILNVANAQNVRIKFQFLSGGGNNIYIDDINIINPLLSVDESQVQALSFEVYPNPSEGMATLEFTAQNSAKADIRLTDPLGKEVAVLVSGVVDSGKRQIKINENKNLASGVYFIKANIDGKFGVKKLIIK